MLLVEDKALQAQVDRILHSDEFRSSEVLRRLLKFLAEKSALGEADQLKEYAVAIDGLGKPHSYEPRHNSAVRIPFPTPPVIAQPSVSRSAASGKILASTIAPKASRMSLSSICREDASN